MPRSTRKRKSGGRKRKSMKGGEGLPNVPAGIQGALHKGTEMGSQLAEKAREMQTMASQEVSQASSAAAEKERQMDASLGAAQEAAAANVSATLDSLSLIHI